VDLISDIVKDNEEFSLWRRDIHAHPELAFEEKRTSEFVAEKLESYGIEVTRGVGKTGVVGTLKVGSSGKSIGLRADMDALPMEELNTFSHKSRHPGCMHGCGHDGHTVMLLAAARYLAKSQNFDGVVQFIFQPAEESNAIGSGAKAMIDDGLFERFNIDNVFAFHNGPELAAGVIATRPGILNASIDLFEVAIRAKGCHGAFPQDGNDPLMIAAQMLTAWQTIVSRNINAQDSVVVSAASINAGNSWTVIPERAVIKGSIRALSPHVRALVKNRFYELTNNIALAFGADVKINYRAKSPSCINDDKQTTFACDVAESVFGKDRVLRTMPADMGSEDFGYLLQKRPGCYLVIGAAPIHSGEDPLKGQSIKELGMEPWLFRDACMLHQPNYDFNDGIIPYGATLFARLAESYLCIRKESSL